MVLVKIERRIVVMVMTTVFDREHVMSATSGFLLPTVMLTSDTGTAVVQSAVWISQIRHAAWLWLRPCFVVSCFRPCLLLHCLVECQDVLAEASIQHGLRCSSRGQGRCKV